MRSKARTVGTAVTYALALLAMASCNGADLSSPRDQGRAFGTETWYEAAFGGSPTEIEIRFDGATGEEGDECEPERSVVVESDESEVRVTVRRYEPAPVVTCPTSAQTATAALPEALGDRALVNPQTGWRWEPAGDRLVLDPDSTPCAREDCSTPAVALASCNPLEYATVVDEQLRPGKAPDLDARCDGSFLTFTRDGRRAWFVNREASWRLVASGEPTCDSVWRAQRIRFPDALCP
jgi:hypothetical protein